MAPRSSLPENSRLPAVPDDLVVMGRVAAPYAVSGWVKIQPFTENTDGLLDYPVWRIASCAPRSPLRSDPPPEGAKSFLGRPGERLVSNRQWLPYRVLEAKQHGQYLVARLEGIDDRNAAEAIRGREVAVERAELPPADEDEYYWDDLVGLTVVNLADETLGQVTGLLETGANDVLEVAGDRARLIPFVGHVIRAVDRANGRIVVDWGMDW